jgi:hypothetical protein
MTISSTKIDARARERAVEQPEQELEASPSQWTGPAFVQHRPISPATLDQSELTASQSAKIRTDSLAVWRKLCFGME